MMMDASDLLVLFAVPLAMAIVGALFCIFVVVPAMLKHPMPPTDREMWDAEFDCAVRFARLRREGMSADHEARTHPLPNKP
jgi:hypothetical protein